MRTISTEQDLQQLRFDAYRTALIKRTMTVNEVRVKEGLPPIEGGDQYYHIGDK